MTIQVPTLRETGITDFALIGFLPGVRTEMLCECRAIGKSFVANAALVGTISRVSPHVRSD